MSNAESNSVPVWDYIYLFGFLVYAYINIFSDIERLSVVTEGLLTDWQVAALNTTCLRAHVVC